MENKIIYQHFLPRFIIKRWSVNDKVNYYSIENKKFSKFNIKIKDKDPFISKEFYENKNYKSNKIENILASIENVYSKIIEQVIMKFDKYKTMRLTRKEIMMIKLYSILQSFRSQTSLFRMNELEGDIIFNNIYAGNTHIQNQEIMLKNILVLFEEYFLKILNNEDVDLELLNNFNFAGIKFKYIELVTNSFLNFAKIENLDENFIINDQLSIQSVDPILAVPILTFMPISPKYCIIFTKTMDQTYFNYNSKLSDNYAREIYKVGFDSNEDSFQRNLTKRNHRVNYLSKGLTSYKDEFIYNILSLSSCEVQLINGFFYSQTKFNLIYIEENDINNAKEMIKQKNIYRIEDSK